MKALTANVFITRSLPAMDKLFFSKERLKTFDQRLKTLSKTQLEQSFIASPIKNDGLMNLEMSVTSNGNASQGKGQTVTMRFLETSKLLELFLLENDPLSEIVSAREEEFRRMRDPGQSTNVKSNPLSKSSITDQLNRTNRYYLAFGTGSDVKKWSGPFTMQLGGASLKNDSNNVRMIELVFVPDLESYKSWSPKFGSVLGYNDNFQNASQFVSEDTVQTAKSSMYINGCQGKIYNLDHRLRVLLKRYISTFTKSEGNAIVVLPDKFGKLEVARPTSRSSRQKYRFFEGIFENYSDFVKTGVRLSKFSIKDIPDQISPNKDGLNYLQDIGLEFIDRVKQVSLNAKDLGDKALDTLRAGGQTARDLQEAFKSVQEKKRLVEISRAEAEFEKRKNSREGPEAGRQQSFLESFDVNVLHATVFNPGSPIAFNPGPTEILFDRFFLDGVRNSANLLISTGRPQPSVAEIIIFLQEAFNLQNSNNEQLTANLRDRDIEKANAAFEQAMKTRSPEFLKFVQEQELATLTSIDKEIEPIRATVAGTAFSFKTPPTLPASPEFVEGLDVNAPFERRTAKLSQLNYEANWDLMTESARTLFVTEDKNIALQMFIELKNIAAQEVYDGFSPLVAPLIKFAAGTKSASKQKSKTSQYDFLEENDIRLLKLWEKYGIIKDSSRPAFIYGDTSEIRRLLYLEGSEPSEHSITAAFELGSFDDFDGEGPFGDYKASPSITSFATPRMLEVSKSKLQARDKYKSFVADFRREFPQPPKLFLKHNDENANVLALNYNVDKYQAVLLNLPVSPSLDKGYIGTSRVRLAKAAASEFVSENVVNALSKIEAPTFTEFVTEMSQSYRGAASFDVAMNLIESDKFDAIKDKKVIDLLSVLFFIQNVDTASFGNAEKLGKEFGVTKKIDANSLFDQYYEAILDQTMKLLYNCNVRTYPMFNEKIYFKRGCRLDGNTGGIVGFPEKLRYNAPYNGDYTVLGFKHVISTDNIYTEFDLVRVGMDHKFASGDVKVKDFFCKVLWDNLGISKEEYYKKLVDVKFNEVPTDESFLAWFRAWSAKASNYTGLGKALKNQGLGLSPQERTRNYYKKNGFINERFERIEKALKTMGCL